MAWSASSLCSPRARVEEVGELYFLAFARTAESDEKFFLPA